jgi:hypothetical protein
MRPNEKVDTHLTDELPNAIDRADHQLTRGQFSDYDETTLQRLAEGVKTRGRARLAKERASRRMSSII